MRAQINLVDPSLLPQVQHLPAKRVLLLVLCAAGLVTMHYSYERVQLGKTVAMGASNEATANPLLDASTDEAFEILQKQLNRDELLRDGLSKLTDLPEGTADVLANVIAALPEQLWLTELEFIGKRGIRLRGGATAHRGLAEFSSKLAKVSALAGLPVEVVSLRPATPTASEAVNQSPASAPVISPTADHFDFELATIRSQGARP